MKKCLSSVLVLTLIFNFIGSVCRAESDLQTISEKTTVSESLKRINNSLTRIKEKRIRTNTKDSKDIQEKTQNTDGPAECIDTEHQEDKDKPKKETYREKRINRLKKKLQKIENTSDEKYFHKSFFDGVRKLLCDVLFILYGGYFFDYIYKKAKYEIRPIIMSILTTLHPDNLNQIKNSEDIKKLYYLAANYYDDHLK